MMRKNYKEIFIGKDMNLGKRGQMTIFVIVALVIVLVGVLLFLFWPKLKGVFGVEVNPNQYLSECITPEIRPAIETLSNQGGYKDPEGYTLLDGKKIQYLCYTDDYYEPCMIQQPMTKQHFEKELNLMVKGKAKKCVDNLIDEYKKEGYDVSSGGINSEVSVVPNKILITFNAPLTVTKETTRKFQSFDIEIESGMYDLLFIASSIVDYEATYGNSATELYLQYYPNLKIKKIEMSDGTTVYKLTDVIRKDEFTFASRSLSWPAGYGTEG